MWFYVEFYAEVVYPAQIGVTAQNGEQPIRLPNYFLYPRVEVEQRTPSGDEIGYMSHFSRVKPGYEWKDGRLYFQ